MPRRHLIIAAAGFGFAVMAMAPFYAFAATLYFLPNTQTVSVGQTFTVAVDASSLDQAMNAASGDISFPSDKVRVLSVSNTHSVMTLWVQNPSFSNAASGGDISFAGIVLNPGFTGTGAEIFTIRFQAIATGEADLHFSSGAVLANDGKGTNILTSMGTAAYTIVPAAPAAPVTASSTATSSAPAGSTISPTTSAIGVAATSTPSNATTGWLGRTLSLLFSWGLIIMLSLILIALMIALIYYIIYRLRRFRLSLVSELEHEKKELREEERRAQREAEIEKDEDDEDGRGGHGNGGGGNDQSYTLDLRPPETRHSRGHY